MTDFELHQKLANDSLFIADLQLCRILLMNNKLFPWLILVPRINNAKEIIDLSANNRHLLMDEISHISELMQNLFKPDKLNIAALGNQVPQLHIHIIARFVNDACWANPVWGGKSEPYDDTIKIIQRIKAAL